MTANFKYKRDLCSFARVSYLNYVSNFKVMYITFYITSTWLNSFSGEKIGITLWAKLFGSMVNGGFAQTNDNHCHYKLYQKNKSSEFSLLIYFAYVTHLNI